VSTGDLSQRLLAHAVEITVEQGPSVVSLREVQRRAGVSPAAAYRHYRDREALMAAVSAHAAAALADRIEPAVASGWQAGCRAYLEFAVEHPGLYRAVFSTEPGVLTDDRAFALLRNSLDARGITARWSDTTVWAACHGFALLLLDGPLRNLTGRERVAARERLLSVLAAGLTSSRYE